MSFAFFVMSYSLSSGQPEIDSNTAFGSDVRTGGTGRSAVLCKCLVAIDEGRFAEHRLHRAVIVGVVGLVLAAGTTILAMRGSPGAVDAAVFRWFNDPPGVVGFVLRCVNPLLRPAGLALIVVAALIVLAVLRPQGTGWLVLSATAAALLAYVVTHALKDVVDRGRPPAYLDDVLVHGYPVDPHGSGFPSSHTSVTVALIVGAWPWLTRPWRIVGVVTATAIGLNRMYVGAHFPLDVLGGIGVGMACGGTVLVVQCSLRQASGAGRD